MRLRAALSLFAVAGVSFLSLTAWNYFFNLDAPPAQGSPAVAKTQEVASPTPTRVITVPSTIKGTITKVLVKEGDTVQAAAPLVRLDDRLAQFEIKMAKLKVQMAEADIKGARGTEMEAKAQIDKVKSFPANFVPEEEIAMKKAFYEKFVNETKVRQLALKMATLELDRARMLLEDYQVTAPVTGTVLKIRKQTGEAVGEMETLIEIAVTDRKD